MREEHESLWKKKFFSCLRAEFNCKIIVQFSLFGSMSIISMHISFFFSFPSLKKTGSCLVIFYVYGGLAFFFFVLYAPTVSLSNDGQDDGAPFFFMDLYLEEEEEGVFS